MPTQGNAGPSLIERRSTFWIVVALIALLFATTNLPWTLDDYDQAKQAFTSFEMVNEGHWFFQHTPNEKIATKPPLVGWISAATYGATRNWEIAWRLPSIAAAIALAVLVTRAATDAYGAAAGLIALSAFGLNMLSPRLATLVRTDMPLALALFLLGLRIWSKIRNAEPWDRGDRLMMFAMLTAAMLIKGPIVYAFLSPGIVAFAWWKSARQETVSAWCGWWPWIGSLAVFLTWVAAGIAWTPGFYEQVVLREFAGRFSETVHRPQPIYFYLPHVLHKFAPWSVLGIALAFIGWCGKKPAAENRSRVPADVAWLLCWSFGGLLVMSLIPSKRVDRIFPIVPPLCLLVSAGVAKLSNLVPRVRRWTRVTLISACVIATGYAVQRLIPAYRSADFALVEFSTEVRREAAARGLRYEVIGGPEEGLLLYLRRTHFAKTHEAISRWNTGSIDALVAPAEKLALLLSELPGASASGLEGSITVGERRRTYVFLTRSSP
ncbi:MAG: hypothetical protein H0X73_02865 [Chthoniobacterales bacterium]|nr:hypothetical protein [Chthoniobacterales bacterium]